MTTSAATVAAILATMVVIALIETVVPLHRRGERHRAHLRPNLMLTLLTFATNVVFNAAVVVGLVRLRDGGVGFLQWWTLSPPIAVVLVVVGLDFSFYVAHVAMHASRGLWRFHRVHHSDPAVDVTTTIRQHPGEGVIRYAFMAMGAFALGASPGAFALYRAWSALHGLAEHANVRVPGLVDRALSAVFATPNMHKVHHSRLPIDTNSNYGNILSVFDRALGTFTPSERGLNVDYGLAGFDDAATQSTWGLLAVPFRRRPSAAASPLASRPAPAMSAPGVPSPRS